MKKAVKSILKEEGVYGLAKRSMRVDKGTEQHQLISVAEMK